MHSLLSTKSITDMQVVNYIYTVLFDLSHTNEVALVVEDLKDKLDEYAKTLPKVKVVHATKREGLIRARLGGAAASTGQILVFLDSHCEANVGWLEPLVERIYLNRKTVVCPVIDLIDSDTFRYSGSPLVRGGFNWGLHFKWKPIPQHELQRRTDATSDVRSPTMAGGLFAVDRDYFQEIGSYDEEMDIWGGENLELSFRIWQCGGLLEIIPCSRVGHVFRKRHPYTFPDGIDHTFSKNSMRVAEVWMDEYKKFYYATRPDLKGKDFGDITKRLELKSRLQCKSFKWFLQNVYPELVIPDENVLAWGEVRNPDSALCLDTLGREEGDLLGLFYCHGGGGNQAFSLTQRLELRHEEFCLDVAHSGERIRLLECHGHAGNQKWEHTQGQSLYHPASGQCLDRGKAESGGNVVMATCDGRPSQLWQFSQYFKHNV
jgi:polypeptide N-acetylgalactosaminyltransferase